MATLPYLFVGFVVLATVLGLIAVWARRRLWVRVCAVVMVGGLMGLQFFALTDLLSRPKPTTLAYGQKAVDEAMVLAATIDEGKAIYLWLRVPGTPEPRYYAMDWDHEDAVALQRAIREAGHHGTAVMMRSPFEKSLDDRPQPRFYDVPRIDLPRKPRPEAFEYRHPSLTI